MQLVFDGHNDALSRLWCSGGDPVERFRTLGSGHVTAPAASAGGFGGGFFALFSPMQRQAFDFTGFKGLEAPLFPPMEQAPALQSVMAQIGVLNRLCDAGLMSQAVTAGGLQKAMAAGQIAALLHLEGAECIDPDLLVLDALYALGLRSLGPVWSRATRWADGVPFAYDQDGDTGRGLTEDGRRLVARCVALGMVVDTSHLTMKGFWDIAEMDVPLVATHSNAFDLCPVSRNLTAEQLRAIGETQGMVGLNLASVFLSPDGWHKGHATVDDCLRQIGALIEHAGEDRVGLGSDFDGAPLPQGIGSVADLPVLVAAMERAGFGAALIDKLCRGNWLRFLARVLGG